MTELSIIIPAMNEEDYLPYLLNSIRSQNYKDYEIIVADNNSRDKTREIARKNGCKIVKGGLPSKARNNGAKIAKGKYLLFLDADVILPKDFLEKVLYKFKKENLNISDFLIFDVSNKNFSKLLYHTSNEIRKILQHLNPSPGLGGSILIKKDLHKEINGFDENLKFGEDKDYILRASKKGKFKMIKEKIFHSERRFEKEGTIKTIWTYIKGFFYGLLRIKNNDIEYKFDHYKD